ncbi:MAG: hypothetical protein JW730_08015 [Anaerolineales bacterium]|nr:hypothetical protein [Anaerolineales bacterium]
MKAFLLFKDRDFDLQQRLPANEQDLVQDLELNTLFGAMAGGDEFLFEVAKNCILSSLDNDLDTVLYRQDILRDCIKNSSLVRDIYQLAIEAIASEKEAYFFTFFSKYPSAILGRSIKVLYAFMTRLRKLRNIAKEHANQFESEGFRSFFAMLVKELSDEYFASVEDHLKELELPRGALISAELGKSNKGINYTLRKYQGTKQSWLEWLFSRRTTPYTITIDGRDQVGTRTLSEIRDSGVNLAANALAQSCDHILGFFKMLQAELAFYVGCLNLHGQLAQLGEPTCFPLPIVPSARRHSARELYDVCLALTMKQKVVGNHLDADHGNLVIITGANQGGKSTFLRSLGLAQLMMQCGMFVPAESFSANLCDGLFTHYKREEDVAMESGKFDEELSRMSDIADRLTANSIVLFNESFASTNEREGSEIARQIVSVLLEKQIKVVFVTHLYKFAHDLYDQKMDHAVFLRAERQPDGSRSFKLVEGEPLQTSFGLDLYTKVFN